VEFNQMSQQFFLVGYAAEVPADHLVSSQRWLATCPQADQHARDNRAVDLHFDAVLRMTQQMTASQKMLEKAKEDLSLPVRLRPKVRLLSLLEALVFMVLLSFLRLFRGGNGLYGRFGSRFWRG
jgi:hypothetical protein